MPAIQTNKTRRPTKARPKTAGKQQPKQGELAFHRNGKRGGYRPRSGRKALPVHKRRGVPHRHREKLAPRYPVHTTVCLRKGLPPLRNAKTLRLLQKCFAAACERFGFRLTHFSVQSNHLHMLCEADDRKALSRGMQGLLIRVAKALNRLWGRKGSVFTERYHEHILRTPREVRNTLCYVLNNVWRHIRGTHLSARSGTETGLDNYASGRFFDGWRVRPAVPTTAMAGAPANTGSSARAGPPGNPPVARSRTWLLNVGWRRCGLICPDEVPRGLERPRPRRS